MKPSGEHAIETSTSALHGIASKRGYTSPSQPRETAAARTACCLALFILTACQPQPGSVERAADPDVVTGASATGTLEGFVRLGGDALPLPTRVENGTDPVICGQVQSLEDLLVAPDSRGIRNVIVALTDVPAARVPPLTPGRLELGNRACRFVPHVSVLTVGSAIVATNDDAVLHNEHFYGALTANVALPLAGSTVTIVADKPGMIILKCDVHGWMQAFIRVDTHPFHDVTDATGHFRIAGIPAGTYRLEIWHEKLGQREETVHITTGKTQTIHVEYPHDSR